MTFGFFSTVDPLIQTQLSLIPRQIECSTVAGRIIAENGIVKIQDLARHSNIGIQKLQRAFETEIGLSPKVFARIIRFNYARHLIEANPNIDLAQLTYQGGYTDQAHFSHNFRELFDRTPADFKRQLKKFRESAEAKKMDVVFLQDN